jgi:hypothetical protein
LNIRHNDTLANLDGLTGVTSVGQDLNIVDNDAVTTLDGLSGITSVEWSLDISSNDALANLDGLDGITALRGDLSIGGNASLTNLNGLDGITSVGGYIAIGGNASLTNLDGLDGITSFTGTLRIQNNSVLTNLNGLAGITSVWYLVVQDNPTLSACQCGLFDLLESDGVADRINIQNNASGCNSVEEILAQETGSCPIDTALGDEVALPTSFAIDQNYPNPFNPSTTIVFAVPHAGKLTLKVYDLLGREVAVLASDTYSAGRHTVTWNASGIPSGVYVYQLEAEGATVTKKMLLQK